MVPGKGVRDASPCGPVRFTRTVVGGPKTALRRLAPSPPTERHLSALNGCYGDRKWLTDTRPAMVRDPHIVAPGALPPAKSDCARWVNASRRPPRSSNTASTKRWHVTGGTSTGRSHSCWWSWQVSGGSARSRLPNSAPPCRRRCAFLERSRRYRGRRREQRHFLSRERGVSGVLGAPGQPLSPGSPL